MIFSNSLMRRRSSLEEFREHWLDPHGPMTAKLPGTRSYFQNHVQFSDGTNELARQMRIDGVAQLSYNSLEDRHAAYGSPELAACNLDSAGFIGAVSRVVTDVDDSHALREAGSLAKAILLVPKAQAGALAPDAALAPQAIVRQFPVARGHAIHSIIEQAGPPNSAVPFLGQEVEVLLELWFAGEDDLFEASAKAQAYSSRLAFFHVKTFVFDVRTHRLL